MRNMISFKTSIKTNRKISNFVKTNSDVIYIKFSVFKFLELKIFSENLYMSLLETILLSRAVF